MHFECCDLQPTHQLANQAKQWHKTKSYFEWALWHRSSLWPLKRIEFLSVNWPRGNNRQRTQAHAFLYLVQSASVPVEIIDNISRTMFTPMSGGARVWGSGFNESYRPPHQWYLQYPDGDCSNHGIVKRMNVSRHRVRNTCIMWDCPMRWSDLHMITSSNRNIFRVTGHLCGEFTGSRWIPHTKASDAGLWCLLWSAPQ